MLLKDYIPNVNKKFRNFFFSGISFDSSKVKKNNIFFAIKGIKFDGNNFIPKAIKKGSKVIISEKKIKEFKNGILFIHTKNIRKLLAEVSYKIYKNKPKNLIAVTGTNGKSSIANFYYQILKLNKKRVASIGTLGVKSNILNLNLLNTTIDPIQLGQILTKLKNLRINDISKLYVNRGPGSFAGIRNSLSTVKAMHLACKIDYYCYSFKDFSGENNIKYENIPNLCDKFEVNKNLINPIYIS